MKRIVNFFYIFIAFDWSKSYVYLRNNIIYCVLNTYFGSGLKNVFFRLNWYVCSTNYLVSIHHKAKLTQKLNSSSSTWSRDQSCKRFLITAINKSWRTNAFQATLHQYQSASLVRDLSEKPTFPLSVLFHFLISRRLWSVGRKLWEALSWLFSRWITVKE
jgi:hypothetical protein